MSGSSLPVANTAALSNAVHVQVWVAVAARCLLHVVYEFQAFVNLYAQKVLSISPGAAAQVFCPPFVLHPDWVEGDKTACHECCTSTPGTGQYQPPRHH